MKNYQKLLFIVKDYLDAPIRIEEVKRKARLREFMDKISMDIRWIEEFQMDKGDE